MVSNLCTLHESWLTFLEHLSSLVAFERGFPQTQPRPLAALNSGKQLAMPPLVGRNSVLAPLLADLKGGMTGGMTLLVPSLVRAVEEESDPTEWGSDYADAESEDSEEIDDTFDHQPCSRCWVRQGYNQVIRLSFDLN